MTIGELMEPFKDIEIWHLVIFIGAIIIFCGVFEIVFSLLANMIIELEIGKYVIAAIFAISITLILVFFNRGAFQ